MCLYVLIWNTNVIYFQNSASKLYMELPFKITLPTSTSIATIGRVDDRLGIYTVIMDAMMKYVHC